MVNRLIVTREDRISREKAIFYSQVLSKRQKQMNAVIIISPNCSYTDKSRLCVTIPVSEKLVIFSIYIMHFECSYSLSEQSYNKPSLLSSPNYR